jgi:hypothetical protein
MAKLVTMIKDPAFSWYPKWIKLNKETDQPKNPIKDVLSQPLMIKTQWSSHNGCKMSFNVVPFKGHPFVPEDALMCTIPDFKKNLFPHWVKDHKEEKIFFSLMFNLFQNCLQGISVTK